MSASSMMRPLRVPYPTAARGSGENGKVPHLSLRERAARGKAERAEVPRGVHGEWSAPPGRRDPVELLEEQAASRVPSWCRSATGGCWSRRLRSIAVRRI